MIIYERVEILENYLNQLCDKGVFPGATFSIIDSDSSYINYLGKFQLSPKEEKLKEDTIYDLASLTKVVATTSAIMILVERGYLTLDTYVKDILPDYKNEGVSIKHLMTHTSGHEADIDCIDMEPHELIKAVYDSKIDMDRFEKEVLYSDIGYILLGFIIEKITGSFEEFIEENLFKPLNMNDTFFNPKPEYIHRCAPTEFCKMRNKLIKGIVHDEKAYLLGGVSGHAGLFSTAKDLTNFIQMYLNYGEFNGKTILNKKTIETIIRCYTENMNEKRALGWMLQRGNNNFCDIASKDTIYHSGFTGTSMIIDLKYKKGFILLTNRIHPSRENQKLLPLRRNIHNIAFSTIKYFNH